MNYLTDSGQALVLAVLAIIFCGGIVVAAFVIRHENAKLDIARARGPAPAASQVPVGATVSNTGRTNPAFAWNVVIIIVGVLTALIGLINGLFASPIASAFQQTVSALWVIQGLLGLLIAAIGFLGTTIARALNRKQD